MVPPDVDADRLKVKLQQIFGYLGGAVTAGMIYLGDRLGLYAALQRAGSATSAELAAATGLHERWIREWLRGQAAAGLVDYRGDDRFALSPEGVLTLADETSPFFSAGGFSGLPQQLAVLERLPDAFRTGIGYSYDAFGVEGARGIERMMAPWFRTALVPLALPRLDGVVAKLERGARVADVGCGAGVAVLEMAKAFPRSEFHGYDVSAHALARAAENLRAAAVTNVAFHDAAVDPLPSAPRFDLVTTFDCMHDMTHPERAARAIRAALAADGTWLIGDVKCRPTFEQNLADHPAAAMMYGFSVLSCMPSALSEPGGAGLGTLGFSEETARALTAAAGFSRFRAHDFENPLNAYYEVRV